MKITITNLKTGETILVDRSVTTEHPEWVHQQLGTQNESNLQRALDGYNVSEWYDSSGKYLGADVCGLSMEED